MFERVKENPIYILVAGACAAVIFVASLGGGVEYISDKWNSYQQQREQDGKPSLELTNVDFAAAGDGESKKDGHYRANFSAILANKGKATVYATVGKHETNIGSFKNDTAGGDFPTLDIGPSLSSIADVSSIAFPLEDGQYREGRLDWTIKYGLTPDKMTEEMIISGSIGVRVREGRAFLTWIPDGNSSRPTGQQPKMLRTPGESGRTDADISTDFEAWNTTQL